LNDRAALNPLPSLWHLDRGWSVFAGPLGRNAPHSHSTAVYLAGLYGKFRLRVGDAAWQLCRAAVVPAGITYEFDVAGEPLGVLYLEPDMGCAESLMPLVRNAEETAGALIGDGDVSHLRALFEQRPVTAEIRISTDDLLGFASRRSRRTADPRVVHALAILQQPGEDASLARIAAAAHLSTSRFQHVFTAEVGVPFRRYRLWQRLRAAIAESVAGATLTDAAHAAGFADQAHFSRAFRATFGAPPSRGL
jgi:AraC-like DNA-binding protein